MARRGWILWLTLFAALGCRAARSSTAPTGSVTPTNTAARPATTSGPVATAAQSPAESSQLSAAPTVPAGRPLEAPAVAVDATPLLRLADLRRVVEAPVYSLAIEPDRGLAAALGEHPWLFDGRTWQPIPLPAALRPQPGERDEVRIFFGRDHAPRIMGTRHGSTGPRPHYLRFRNGAWREEPRELASFARKPDAAIYGVLGWDDPELLCKVGELCLVKQRSGWSQVPLPEAGPRAALRVDLGPDGPFALLEHELLRLEGGRWIAVGGAGPWQQEPAGATAFAHGGWVSVPGEGAVYQTDGHTWTRHASPVREPQGLWAPNDRELWVAGSDGVGFFDGRQFWRVGGIDGGVSEVAGRAGTLWFAGPSGVWRARDPRLPPN